MRKVSKKQNFFGGREKTSQPRDTGGKYQTQIDLTLAISSPLRVRPKVPEVLSLGSTKNAILAKGEINRKPHGRDGARSKVILMVSGARSFLTKGHSRPNNMGGEHLGVIWVGDRTCLWPVEPHSP